MSTMVHLYLHLCTAFFGMSAAWERVQDMQQDDLSAPRVARIPSAVEWLIRLALLAVDHAAHAVAQRFKGGTSDEALAVYTTWQRRMDDRGRVTSAGLDQAHEDFTSLAWALPPLQPSHDTCPAGGEDHPPPDTPPAPGTVGRLPVGTLPPGMPLGTLSIIVDPEAQAMLRAVLRHYLHGSPPATVDALTVERSARLLQNLDAFARSHAPRPEDMPS